MHVNYKPKKAGTTVRTAFMHSILQRCAAAQQVSPLFQMNNEQLESEQKMSNVKRLTVGPQSSTAVHK